MKYHPEDPFGPSRPVSRIRQFVYDHEPTLLLVFCMSVLGLLVAVASVI